MGGRELWHGLPHGVRRLVAREAGAVLLESSRRRGRGLRSLLFRDPVRVFVVRQPGEIVDLFQAIDAALAEGLWVTGYLGYECGYHFEPGSRGVGRDPEVGAAAGEKGGLPLAWFGFYREPIEFDHATGRLDQPVELGGDTGAETAGAGAPSMEIGLEVYARQVEQVKRWIEAGDTYQVNLTTRVRMDAPASAADLFGHMMLAQPVEYGAFLNLGESQILSASPELFFRREGDAIEMRPMKGTASRGMTADEDDAHARWLAADGKNRSENVMIVDLLRNDLGRVCRMGSVEAVRLFEVERYRTVLQMVSTVRGTLRPGVSWYQLFRALFPSGSIIGAPKIRTMQLVRELEGRERGVYTGSIGTIAPDGRAAFSVAIRTVVVRDGEAEMGVGSGVVWDSDAEAEYWECRGKASFLSEEVAEFRLLETMLWDGEFAFAEEHLARLLRSASRFDFDIDGAEVRSLLAKEAVKLQVGRRYRVRLLADESGALEVSSQEIAGRHEDPVRVLWARERTFSGDLFLRHKTTRRDRYDVAYAEAERAGCADVIFRNERGEVTEGAIHNVLVVKDGVWKTPPVSAGVLPGIYRAWLMAEHGVIEGTVTEREMRAADAVFLCNSVRGLRKVGEVVVEGGGPEVGL